MAPLPARAAQKAEMWVEVRSPHFVVASNSTEKQARRVADQFEQIRAVFEKALPGLRVDPGQPILILATKNESSLKTLLPEYWEQKGHTHPAGIFLAGPEKHYVALRLDAAGENPYHTIYHEYVHALLRLNYRRLPTWLNEGIAEFYGNTSIGARDLLIGQPDVSHVELLRTSRLLPLEVLLQAGPDSPHYNEANKASLFYAESWAVVHYFMLDPEMRKTQALNSFARLVGNDVEDLEAARQALGDLKQLQKKIEDYVRQPVFQQFRLDSPSKVGEQDFVARPMSAAESAALRGDFHLHMRREAEARSLLEEALRLDPRLALAHESMGQLYLHLGDREEAARCFAQAVQLDSHSYLAHYYHAMLRIETSPSLESVAQAESSLRRAIELNPNFAPAYASLADAYSIRPLRPPAAPERQRGERDSPPRRSSGEAGAASAEPLNKALEAARKAVQLEPGEIQYYLGLGRVLLRLERFEEARDIGQRALAGAKSPEVRTAAESFLQQVARYQVELEAQKRFDEQLRASRQQLEEDLRGEPPTPPPAGAPQTPSGTRLPPARRGGPAGQAGSGKDEPDSGASTTRRYSMFGKITALSCSHPPAMELTLSFGGITMRLHAADRMQVEYKGTGWKPPKPFDPCKHLQGLSAQVSYTLAQDPPAAPARQRGEPAAASQPYDGEILSLEVRK